MKIRYLAPRLSVKRDRLLKKMVPADSALNMSYHRLKQIHVKELYVESGNLFKRMVHVENVLNLKFNQKMMIENVKLRHANREKELLKMQNVSYVQSLKQL